MARAAYIIKKDGRYWFQKRFAALQPPLSGLGSHCRIALRTADYRVAISRMLRVAQMVQQFEILPDIAARARALLADMLRLSVKLDADAMVERRTLETLVVRLITEARLRGHPLTVDPPDFWLVWTSFVNSNVLVEQTQDLSRRAPIRVSLLEPSSPDFEVGDEEVSPSLRPASQGAAEADVLNRD